MKKLDRRTFLRGALAGVGTCVALPALDIMSLSSKASAQPAIPNRFGLWFWGNGVKPDRWVPGTVGAGWAPSPELAPLAPVRDYVSVVSGCEIKTATHPHHSGFSGILTGARYHQNGTTRDTIVSTCAGPSVDMIAAASLGGETPFRSLEIGITRFRGTDEGSAFQHLSHNGPNNINPSEYSPASLFSRLFGMPVESDVDLARRSVLDSVSGQIRALQTRVGGRDRLRLEQHFASVRQLEMRLAAGASACMAPTNPGDFPDVEGREQIEQQNRAMSDLLVLALACDLTRVFSVLFSPSGSGVIVWPAGASNSLHQTCHDEAGAQPIVHAATTYTMEQLSYFLQRLAATPEGDGNLLQHSSILCTTELTNGQNHSNRDYPILIAGRGNGRLRGGIHWRGSDHNTSHGPLTALRGAGVAAGAFGAAEGRVTDSIGELES